MKKYLGSRVTAFAAIVAPCFIVGSALFSVVALLSKAGTASVLASGGCFLCSIIWGVYLKQLFPQLYTWAHFRENGLYIKTAFLDGHTVSYSDYRSIGIGYYTHGFLNRQVGIKVCFVFFSCEPFDERYRTRINLWKPSKHNVKVEFREELYRYLLSILPPRQAKNLHCDYNKYCKG